MQYTAFIEKVSAVFPLNFVLIASSIAHLSSFLVKTKVGFLILPHLMIRQTEYTLISRIDRDGIEYNTPLFNLFLFDHFITCKGEHL